MAVENLDVDNGAVFAVGNAQRGVSDLSCLFAENGAQQPLLGGHFGLALGGDLTHKNVAGANLGADADDSALVKVLKGVLAHVRDVSCYLFGSELCVSGLELVFFNMN